MPYRAESSSAIQLATPVALELPLAPSAGNNGDPRHTSAIGSSEPSFGALALGPLPGPTTAVTTPGPSSPNGPDLDVLGGAMHVVHAGLTEADPTATAAASRHSSTSVQPLDGLERAAGTVSWPQAYDLLLLSLARYGDAMPNAPRVAYLLWAGAARRITTLVTASAAPASARPGHVRLDTRILMRLLGRLKLNHGSKRRLAEFGARLGELDRPARTARDPLEGRPQRPRGLQAPTSTLRPTAPRLSNAADAVVAPTSANASIGASATAPVHLDVNVNLNANVDAYANVNVAAAGANLEVTATAPGPPRRPLPVRKVSWRTPSALPGLDEAAPISLLQPVGVEASQQAAALVMVGGSFARGGQAKIKPALLLQAGVAYSGAPMGAYVARTVGERRRTDPIKHHLRGAQWTRPCVTSAGARLAEAEALEAANSELRPVLTLADEKDNVYQLVRRLDVDVWRAVHRDEGLGRNAAFVRAVLDGVLPRLAGLHAADILHHDIKPENLLVDVAHARVVLADYGLACRRTPDQVVERGTHLYAPPEMARLAHAPERFFYGPRELTGSVDLYALAVTVARLVAPSAFAASPFAYPQPDEVRRCRPDLVELAFAQLASPRAAKASRATTQRAITHRAYALYVERTGEAYVDWYDDHVGALVRVQRADQLNWRTPSYFSDLLGEIAAVDLVVARLVAQGLHPDPRRRGSASAWAQSLRLASAPSVLQVVELKRRLAKKAHEDPYQRKVDRAFDQLRAAAAEN